MRCLEEASIAASQLLFDKQVLMKIQAFEQLLASKNLGAAVESTAGQSEEAPQATATFDAKGFEQLSDSKSLAAVVESTAGRAEEAPQALATFDAKAFEQLSDAKSFAAVAESFAAVAESTAGHAEEPPQHPSATKSLAAVVESTAGRAEEAPQVPDAVEDKDLVLGRYRLDPDGKLGNGGWCVVWRAKDLRQDLPVAVKTFHDQALQEADVCAARFKREVDNFKALGVSLRHRAAVPADVQDPCRLFVNLIDFSCHGQAMTPWAAGDGRHYTVLELAEESLEAHLRRRAKDGSLSPREVREIARAVARSLSWMHSKQVCHLDIKPDNIMRFRDGWKLIDLEGCVRLGEQRQLCVDCFTPLYTSPEVARAVLDEGAARNCSAQLDLSPSKTMDVWSAGVVLMDVVAHGTALEDTWSGFQMAALMDFGGEEDGGALEQWYQWLSDPEELKVSDYVTEREASAALLRSSPQLEGLLQQLLLKDPAARLSTEGFLAHPFLA